MLLKNTWEYGVFEIHAKDICSVCTKKARPFIRAVIRTLSVKIAESQSIDLSKYNGRFVRVRGKIKNIKTLGKGAKLIFLYHKRMKKGLPVISFENQRKWLGLDKISKNDYL
jgi:hypothetical protein